MIIEENNEINQNEWKTMSVDKLLEQKSKLLDRYEIMSKRNVAASKMILQGIYEIDNLISNK